MPKPSARPSKLVAEADAEEGDPSPQHLARAGDLLVGGRGVAGSVGEEDAVDAEGADLLERHRGGHDVDVDAALCQAARGHRLDAEVDGGDGELRLPHGGHEFGLAHAHLVGELGTGHRRSREHGLEHRPWVRLGGGTGEDAHAHRALVAQMPGERTGVDVLDPHDPRLGEVGLEVALGAPVRRDPGGVADDVAGHPDLPGLVIGRVDAGVADVRSRLDDDLPVVGGVGQGLLVAGHRGDEDGFADGLPDGSVGGPGERAAVFEHEDGGSGGQSHGASTIISLMRLTVGAVSAE